MVFSLCQVALSFLEWEGVTRFATTIPFFIAFIVTLRNFLRDKGRHALFFTLSWLAFLIWIFFEALRCFINSIFLIYAIGFASNILAYFLTLFLESIRKEKISRLKMGLIVILGTIKLIILSLPGSIIEYRYPDNEVTLRANELGYIIATLLVLLVGFWYFYFMVRIYKNSPSSLKYIAGINLSGGMLLGIISPVVMFFWTLNFVNKPVIDILSDIFLSSGILLTTYAFTRQPQLAYILPFKVFHLSPFEVYRLDGSIVGLISAHSRSRKKVIHVECPACGALGEIERARARNEPFSIDVATNEVCTHSFTVNIVNKRAYGYRQIIPEFKGHAIFGLDASIFLEILKGNLLGMQIYFVTKTTDLQEGYLSILNEILPALHSAKFITHFDHSRDNINGVVIDLEQNLTIQSPVVDFSIGREFITKIIDVQDETTRLPSLREFISALNHDYESLRDVISRANPPLYEADLQDLLHAQHSNIQDERRLMFLLEMLRFRQLNLFLRIRRVSREMQTIKPRS